MALDEYRRKRDFAKSPEPRGGTGKAPRELGPEMPNYLAKFGYSALR